MVVSHTFVAVLKAANLRSLAFLYHLGFVMGSTLEAVAFAVEADERLTVKSARCAAGRVSRELSHC